MRASPELRAGPEDEPQNEQSEIARLEKEIALRRERVGASFEELRPRVRCLMGRSHPEA
jgi:hypothetical protein